MEGQPYEINIYDTKNVDPYSCSFRLPESFVRQAKDATIYISSSDSGVEDAVEELQKLSQYKEILKSPDEFFQHMQGHRTELSLVLSAFSIANLSKSIIEALKKQIPQKPYNESKIRMTWYSKCLICNNELPYVLWYENLKYCPNCGQALDWT